MGFCLPLLTARIYHREPHRVFIDFWQASHYNYSVANMSQFRAAKLDIGCFAKIRNIRDHTKRKVYMENEPERYAPNFFTSHHAQGLMRW
jgi:hypothetical protein